MEEEEPTLEPAWPHLQARVAAVAEPGASVRSCSCCCQILPPLEALLPARAPLVVGSAKHAPALHPADRL